MTDTLQKGPEFKYLKASLRPMWGGGILGGPRALLLLLILGRGLSLSYIPSLLGSFHFERSH